MGGGGDQSDTVIAHLMLFILELACTICSNKPNVWELMQRLKLVSFNGTLHTEVISLLWTFLPISELLVINTKWVL